MRIGGDQLYSVVDDKQETEIKQIDQEKLKVKSSRYLKQTLIYP